MGRSSERGGSFGPNYQEALTAIEGDLRNGYFREVDHTAGLCVSVLAEDERQKRKNIAGIKKKFPISYPVLQLKVESREEVSGIRITFTVREAD